MDFKIVIPVIISFVISVILAPVIIPFLRRLKASQTERTDGVKSHLSKAGFFLPNYFVGRLSPLPNGHIKPRNGEKFGAVYSPEDEETAPNTVYHT